MRLSQDSRRAARPCEHERRSLMYSVWGSRVWQVLSAGLITIASLPAAASKTADVSGVIFTLDSSHTRTPWPNARVTLKNLNSNSEVSTVSNDLGQYRFAGVLCDNYEI